MTEALSLVGLFVMGLALAALYPLHALVASGPVAIAAQVGAVLLMIWACLTFGGRSFHARADPTAGGLVTTGPYRYIRHPIYTAGCVFGWAGILCCGARVSISRTTE